MTLGFIFKISGSIWIFGNIFMMTLIGYSISKIFIKENKKQMNIMLLFLIMLYPVERMAGAGWAATTVNYIWPLALGLFSLISIRKMWDGEKIGIIKGILFVIALVYSCNQELCCGVLIVTYILFAIILIILSNPGNEVRKMDETVGYLPDYYSLSTVQKLATGVTATIGELISSYTITFAVFTFMISVYIYTNYKDKFIRAIGMTPFILTMLFSYLNPITNNIYVIKLMRDNFLVEQSLISSRNYTYIGSYINLIISLIIIISIFVSLLLIFKKIRNNIAFYVFGCGLVTRLALAFSPTIFVSKNRTFIIMEFCYLICTLLIWQEFEKDADKKTKHKVYSGIMCLSIVQYLISLCFVLATHVGV